MELFQKIAIPLLYKHVAAMELFYTMMFFALKLKG